MNDPVNNPKHYEFYPDMDAIEVIRRTLSYQEYIGYLKGNALKYRLRAGDKGDTQQDIDKSNWYRKALRDVLPNESAQAVSADVTPEEDEAWDEKRIDVIGQNGNEGLNYCDHTAGLHSYSSTKEAQCIDCKEMLKGGDDAKLTQHKRKSGVGPDT